VIAVNNSWELAPWADVLYGCDAKWWEHYRPAFAGDKWSQADASQKRHWTNDQIKRERFGCKLVDSVPESGLSKDPTKIHQGGNGVYQAVGLAFHFGARRIYLLGVDLHIGSDSRQHWHSDHPEEVGGAKTDACFLSLGWLENFKILADDLRTEGVEFVNATPGSKLTYVKHVPIDQLLRGAVDRDR